MTIVRSLRKTISRISPILLSKILYYIKMKRRLNIRKPQTFNEKINYLKLKCYPNNQLIIDCSDKYKVREYVKGKGLEKHLIKLTGVWNNEKEIIFEGLPKQFVLKCNHGCGYNILCKNKNNFDVTGAKKKLRKWLKEDFSLVSGEPHYSSIERKIICEEYLADDICDYKFFCFKGKPEFFYISQNVNGDFHNMQASFFYCDGTPADFYRTDHERLKKNPILPKNLDKMITIANKLSEDFEFVRVDLYNIRGKIYFSELTFSPCSGLMPLKPEKTDLMYGKMIDINGEKYD